MDGTDQGSGTTRTRNSTEIFWHHLSTWFFQKQTRVDRCKNIEPHLTEHEVVTALTHHLFLLMTYALLVHLIISDTLLQGILATASHVDQQQEGDSPSRWLQDSDSEHTSSSHSDSKDNDSYLLFMCVIVGLVLVCYLVCMVQMVRMCFCRNQRERDAMGEAQLSDRIFKLSTLQRRAILEMVFSENSKAVTESDLKKPKNDCSEKNIGQQESVQHDDIGISTLATTSVALDLEEHDEWLDLEDPVNATLPPTLGHNSAAPTPAASLGASVPASDDIEIRVSSREDGIGDNRWSFPWQKSHTPSQDDSDTKDNVGLTLAIPHFGSVRRKEEEESKEEEREASVLKPQSVEEPMLDAVSKCECESEDDDNCCAICLSNYEEGEVLIASKYCTHLFHRDCILEWLEKHDNCPSCRVGMVTTIEINKAASSLVGKTRMIKAMECISASPTPPPSPGGRRSPSGRRSPAGRHTPMAPRGGMTPTGRG